jgi:hypothetical protein
MPRGPALLAARETDRADGPRLVERLPLADDESTVGTLLIGRRSDGNATTASSLRLLPALAEALRVARSRQSRDSVLQERLEEMAARLAQLEGGAPKTA